MASWTHSQTAAAVAAPVARPRRRARVKPRAHARRGVLWIAVSGILLAGVVFVNVAVLRLNLSLDGATRERAKLRAENAALSSQLSQQLASPRIQSRALHELGLQAADPAAIGYVDLAR